MCDDFFFCNVVFELMYAVSQASSCGQSLDKKQRILEKQLGDWKQKCDELLAEVEGCQKESRQHASELFKLKTAHEETLEQLEAMRRENKAYQGTHIARRRVSLAVVWNSLLL